MTDIEQQTDDMIAVDESRETVKAHLATLQRKVVKKKMDVLNYLAYTPTPDMDRLHDLMLDWSEANEIHKGGIQYYSHIALVVEVPPPEDNTLDGYGPENIHWSRKVKH